MGGTTASTDGLSAGGGTPPGPQQGPATPPPDRSAGAVLPPPDGFTPEVAAALRTYVYLLVDPRTGRPFAAGRGKGDRCFRHLAAARARSAGDGASADEDTFPQLDRIREIEAQGRAVRVDVVRYGLSSSEAKLVEAVVRDTAGLPPGPGGTQRAPAPSLNVALAPRAKFKRSHPVVLLRLGPDRIGQTDDELRHGWRIARRWTDLSSPRSPRWAVVVAEGLVRSVVRLDAWVADEGLDRAADRAGEEGAEPGRSWPRSAGAARSERFSFRGERDPDLERRYLGRNVEAYLGTRSPSAVTYVWCGPHWVNTPR